MYFPYLFLISPSESITIAFLRWSAAAGTNIFGVEIMAWAIKNKTNNFWLKSMYFFDDSL